MFLWEDCSPDCVGLSMGYWEMLQTWTREQNAREYTWGCRGLRNTAKSFQGDTSHTWKIVASCRHSGGENQCNKQMTPTFQLARKDSHWFTEIYLGPGYSCPSYSEDTPKLQWGSNKKILNHKAAVITVHIVQEQDKKLLRSRRMKTWGTMRKEMWMKSEKTI